MNDEIKIENLEELKASVIDVKEFEGTKAKVDKIEVIDGFTSYNDDGVWEEGLQRPIKRMKVSSEVLKVIESSKGSVELRATMIFNLKAKTDKTGKVIGYGWTNSPNSRLYKFLKKMKVNSPQELLGKYILVTTRPSRKQGDEREFLGFVCE